MSLLRRIYRNESYFHFYALKFMCAAHLLPSIFEINKLPFMRTQCSALTHTPPTYKIIRKTFAPNGTKKYSYFVYIVRLHLHTLVYSSLHRVNTQHCFYELSYRFIWRAVSAIMLCAFQYIMVRWDWIHNTHVYTLYIVHERTHERVWKMVMMWRHRLIIIILFVRI